MVKNIAIQLFNEHWYLSVINTEIHETLNVITAIKQSDIDNVVVVGTDMYRTIQPSQWLPQHQHINSKKKDI